MLSSIAAQILPFLKQPLRRSRVVRGRRSGTTRLQADAFDAGGLSEAPAGASLALDTAQSAVEAAAEIAPLYYGSYWQTEDGRREASHKGRRRPAFIFGDALAFDESQIRELVRQQLASSEGVDGVHTVVLPPGTRLTVEGQEVPAFASSYLDEQKRIVRFAAMTYRRPSEPFATVEESSNDRSTSVSRSGDLWA